MAQGIQNILSNSHYYDTTQQLSTDMQSQDGVGKAVALLTEHLQQLKAHEYS